MLSVAADQGPPGDAKGKREPGGSDKDKKAAEDESAAVDQHLEEQI